LGPGELRRELFLEELVEDVLPTEELLEAAKKLVEYYKKVHGFTAGSVAAAWEALRAIRRECSLRLLAFTGNIVATGLRALLAWLVEKGHFNLVITTCGAIDHDVAKSFGGKYYKGSFYADDSVLEELGIHRLGNVYIPREHYGQLIERVVKEVFESKAVGPGRVSGYELLWTVGSRTQDSKSILRAAWLTKTPVVVPGFYDGAFGTSARMLSKFYGVSIDLSLDQELLERLFFTKEGAERRLGALIVGGGISKHHAIWWSQFAGGLDYAVYVTTAVEYDGSLSGAHPREAITWGKIKKAAKTVVVYGDATVLLPILASALL